MYYLTVLTLCLYFATISSYLRKTDGGYSSAGDPFVQSHNRDVIHRTAPFSGVSLVSGTIRGQCRHNYQHGGHITLPYLSWILTLAMLAWVPTHSSSLMSSCPILTSTLPPRQLRLSKQCAAVRMCFLNELVLICGYWRGKNPGKLLWKKLLNCQLCQCVVC